MAATISCDRCGVVLVERAKRLEVYGWKGGYREGAALLDLCEPCRDALKAWLADRPAADTGEGDTLPARPTQAIPPGPPPVPMPKCRRCGAPFPDHDRFGNREGCPGYSDGIAR